MNKMAERLWGEGRETEAKALLDALDALNRALDRIRIGESRRVRLFIERGTAEESCGVWIGTRVDGMAHSLQYQITESVRVVEIEVGKLLDLAAMLKAAGNDDLATAVSSQANKLLEAAVALRIAMAS